MTRNSAIALVWAICALLLTLWGLALSWQERISDTESERKGGRETAVMLATSAVEMAVSDGPELEPYLVQSQIDMYKKVLKTLEMDLRPIVSNGREGLSTLDDDELQLPAGYAVKPDG